MLDPAQYGGGNLVFLVGCPRSGTTWLQRLLASHPKVRTGQESKLFSSYIGPQLRAWRYELEREQHRGTATGRGGTGLSCYFEEEEFLLILKNYLHALLSPMVRNLQAGELFLEKTPGHALALREITELLPESRIIHILRDPRDVVASMLAASRSWGRGWAPARCRDAAATWVRHVQAVRQMQEMLPPHQLLEISYEQLWQNPEVTLKEVINFLNLEWHDAGVAQAIAANQAGELRAGKGTDIPLAGETAKRAGGIVRDPAEFVRRAQPGAWREDLSAWQKLIVYRIARPLMKEAGYA